MNHLETRVAQVGIPVQLLAGAVRIGVFDGAVRLRDRPLLTP
jgi:hypothetical protein